MHDSWVALGDSFTEGLDDRRPDGTFRGWADLVAAELAAARPGFRYANLAVRGRRLAAVRDEQLPRAERSGAALLTVAAGGNDLLGLRCDLAALAEEFSALVGRMAATGATVLVFTGPHFPTRLPLARALAARTVAYNAAIEAAAQEHGALVVDLWRLPGLELERAWAPDRLHLSPAGHAVVAAAVLGALGREVPAEPDDLRRTDVRRPWPAGCREDVRWVRTHLAPWVGRKVRGRSTGDLVAPKLPELTEVRPADLGVRSG